MATDPDEPVHPAEAEAVARLRRAFAEAADLAWSFEARDVTEGAHRRRWVPARPAFRLAGLLSAGLVVLLAATIVVLLVAPIPTIHLAGPAAEPSTTAGSPSTTSPAARHLQVAACTTSVHGAVQTQASVVPGYLPGGFHLSSGSPGDISAGTVTYSLASPVQDPPRVQISLDQLTGPLTPAVGGRTLARSVQIQGRPGLLETGPPAPAFVSAYWKPGADVMVSVVGYDITAATVLRVAGDLAVTLGGVLELPVSPGPIVSRQEAITVAERRFPASHGTAKLSSWTELQSLLQATPHGPQLQGVPPLMRLAPWRPIWVVLLAQPGASSRAVVIVDAAYGSVDLAVEVAGTTSWFSALTDRDPSLGGCPGGSTARLPFGVLTRDEEEYTLRGLQPPGLSLTATFVVKLTTVPSLNAADPGLYGGCVTQSCTIDELVWPTIEIMRAPHGGQLPCPPPWMSSPTSVRSKPTNEYFSIGVPDNYESGCGPLPGFVARLKDLAPPS